MRARNLAWIFAASLFGALALIGTKRRAAPAAAPIVHVERVATPAPTQPERRPSAPAPAASGAGASAAVPVFDLATLAGRGGPEPSVERDRFRTNERFTADDLAHPERYFEATEHVPELRRDQERGDVLEYFLAYRAELERELADAGADAGKRAPVLVVIQRYDAAIARLRSALATPAP